MTDYMRESLTLRAWDDGGIDDVDMRLQLFSMSSASYTDRTLAQLQWTPVAINLTSGQEPSSLMFRIPYDTLTSADKSALAIVRTFSYFQLARFTGKLNSYQRGLSRQGLAVPQLITTQQTTEADAREQLVFNYSDWPRIVAKIVVRNGKLHHLGTFYLSNVSEGDDNGVVATFSDARWLNARKVLTGGFVRLKKTANANDWDRVYDPHYPLIFNPGGLGNKTIRNTTTGATGIAATKEAVSFCQPNEVGDANVTARWTLYDMLQYLWLADDGVQGVERPTATNNTSFQLFAFLGGEATPELSIEGLTITQAIDRIVSAAINYGWTFRPASRYNSNTTVLWLFEKNRWEADDRSASSANQKPVVMPSRDLVLPTPGVAVQAADVNVVSHSCDVAFADRYGRVEVVGDPIIIESTFSTDASEDRACLEYDTTATSGTQSLFWQGDTAAFQAAYIAATGSRQARIQAARQASNVAYCVVALTAHQTSVYNAVNGYGFANHVVRTASLKRQFLPYRLPDIEGTAPLSTAGSANQYPPMWVWVRKPSSADWVLLDEEGRRRYGGFDVDPDVGGIRFDTPMVTIAGSGASTTFTAWDVRVTAAVEYGEAVKAEAWRADGDGSSARIVTRDKFRKWLRWNALGCDGTTYTSEIVLDECDKALAEAKRRLSQLERIRVSGQFNIPWCEMLYQVGDLIKFLKGGSSNAGSGYPPTSFEIGSAVVAVRMNLQGPPYTTSIYTENEVQRED